jgi:putative chitinase
MITVHREQLRLLCPDTAIPQYLFRNMDTVLLDYCIMDRPRRLAHFFAQVMHETNGLTSLRDNFDYSAERIVALWPRRFRNLREALPFAHNPIGLANRLYRDRLGNRDSGDGFWFIGRGLLRITGRAMYERIGETIGADLVRNPDLVLTPEFALPAACEVWRAANGNALADCNDAIAITCAIKGASEGLASRSKWLARTREIWPQEH